MKSEDEYDLVVVGGGAAGFFCAIRCAEINPALRILILEKSNKYLAKVKVSGGGRCNVTHACFDPREMVQKYPRGNKELLGPFHRFLCGDMMTWLSDHGVETKIESDGRVFPKSNSSQTIIECFENFCQKLNITIRLKSNVTSLIKIKDHWKIETDINYTSTNVLWATGSSPAAWKTVQTTGHQLVPSVPSLFTFNIKQTGLNALLGLSVPNARVSVFNGQFNSSGPLLITHWGLSGPAVLKVSAWAARQLHECNYDFQVQVNWLGIDELEVKKWINDMRAKSGKTKVDLLPISLPKRLWKLLTSSLSFREKPIANLNKKEIAKLIQRICSDTYHAKGKTTFKDEFVTCGGVLRKEINFRTMESKIKSGLFFAGEVLDIDAVTGGFNFQAAWTEAFIAAEAITSTSERRED